MTMATLLGGLAFLLALGALWFTAEILKRMDAAGTGKAGPEIAALKNTVAQRDRAIGVLEGRVATLESRLREINGRPAVYPAMNEGTFGDGAMAAAASPQFVPSSYATAQ